MVITPTYTTELELLEKYRLIAGVDEAGRGPLAGPVVSAVVILDPDKTGKYRSQKKWWKEIKDSKALSARKREVLAGLIRDFALDWAVGEVSHEEIDLLNIHNASLLSMKRAIENMTTAPEFILTDGRFQIPGVRAGQKAVIDADANILSVACASILAKVYRDELMMTYAEEFSDYGFERHKGYNTAFHRKALYEQGPTPIHRKTFSTVREAMSESFQN